MAVRASDPLDCLGQRPGCPGAMYEGLAAPGPSDATESAARIKPELTTTGPAPDPAFSIASQRTLEPGRPGFARKIGEIDVAAVGLHDAPIGARTAQTCVVGEGPAA